MAIILDADVIIRGEKGLFDLKTWLAAQDEDEVAVAAITIACTSRLRWKRMPTLRADLRKEVPGISLSVRRVHSER